MDKNDDIRVNKVDKWCEGVADVSLLQAKKSVDMFLCCYSPMLSIEALDAVRTIYVYLDEALDHFNELEARHQKDTGLISEYEEENKKLKNELDISTDECDALISRVFKQDEEYTKLEAVNEDLRSKCDSKEEALQKHIGRYPWGCLGKYDKLSLQVSSLKKENDNLKQTLLNILEKLETKVGLCRVHLLDSYEDRANLIMVEHDRLLIKYEKLKKENDELKTENNNLTTDNKRLNNAVEAWFDMFDDMRHKRDLLKKEYEKLKETNKSLRRTVRILDGEGYF